MVDPRLVEALRFQRMAVDRKSLSSPLYAALLDATIADVDAGGPCARVLERMPAGLDPSPDAVVLRFLGAVHRLVLGGAAPALARWYPSAGGRFEAGVDDPASDFLAAVEAHADEVVAGLGAGVQTNEVGRCATLAVGFTALLRELRCPLRLLEVGASAGLNLRWDRWRYESGSTSWGDPAAPLRFGDDAYRDPEPDVSAPIGPDAAVAARLGCDRSPIDAGSPEGRLLLRSFVWPDQVARLARLDAALAVAGEVPAAVDAVDAGEWVAARLGDAAGGVTSVVYHSIVWQYLPPATRDRMDDALHDAGRRASPEAPVAWLRMEPPADPMAAAELRLTTWTGGAPTERLLARSGYHGRPVSAA